MGIVTANPLEVIFTICGLVVTAWLLNRR